MGSSFYPLLFEPIYKDYIWGGTRIGSVFQRGNVPPVCAESWELSAHADGPSLVKNGPFAGLTLAELTRRYGVSLVGSLAPDPSCFPLLFKIIDARAQLSVQVHPNAATAASNGGTPKTEMWVVLDCEPNASLFAGFNPGVDAEKLRQALTEKNAAACLAELPVRPGDALYIPGGLVHAIGAGCLIYEVQQTSNTTYRLYDWGRLGENGLPRPVHIEQALAHIDWTLPVPVLTRGTSLPTTHPLNTWTEILTTPHFHLRRLELTAPETLVSDASSFQVLFVCSGAATATVDGSTVDLPLGTSCLIPAATTTCLLSPRTSAKILLTTLA